MHSTPPPFMPAGRKITLIISLQCLAFSDMWLCENLSDFLSVNTKKCDGECSRLHPIAQHDTVLTLYPPNVVNLRLVLRDCATDKGEASDPSA